MSISRAKRQQINLPSGNNTEIQYNDNGAFGGSSNLTFDGTTLNVTGDMSHSGNYTNTAMPAFSAVIGSDYSDVTGDGTPWIGRYDTERFDQGSDYNTTTYEFTAPVTGKYQFNLLGALSNISSSHSFGNIWLMTSNKIYYTQVPIDEQQSGVKTMGLAVLADMDAGDTAYVRLTGNGSTKTVGITGSTAANGFHAINFFTGYLVC